MAQNPDNQRRSRPSTATRVLLVLTLLAGLFFLVLVVGVVWLVQRSETGKVAEASFLRIELEGAVGDAPPRGGIFTDPNKETPVPTTIARGLRKAATDDRIHGVYLVLNGPTLGWANAQEIRNAIVDFRKSGKPCVAYAEQYETGSYYVASACDKVVLAPSGAALVAGLSTSITYYSGTLEKLGITPEFEHVGEYKSAIEVFTRTEPSPEAQEAYNSFIDSIWTRFLADVASSRGKTPEDIQALIDDPPMAPKDALARGLVDAVAFQDGVEAHLDEVKEPGWEQKLDAPTVLEKDEDEEDVDEERFTDMDEYLKVLAQDDAGKADKIAVIMAEGNIVSGDSSGGGLFGGDMLTDGGYHEWMEDAREDDSVKAVVVRVNSPGGSGLASDNMWREVQRTKAMGKPVVVSMANYAASGGYFMSCNSDWIVAEPSTLTGSIGVFGGKMTFNGTYDKIGMTQFQFKRGQLADLFSPTAPFTDQGRVVFRSYLQNFYDIFVNKVADGRHKQYADIDAIAKGRVWTGDQALQNGLVDQIGGLDVAVAKAAELGKVTDYGLERWPKQKSFFDVLVEDMAKSDAGTPTIEIDSAVPGAADALREAAVADRVLSDGGVAAWWPGVEVK